MSSFKKEGGEEGYIQFKHILNNHIFSQANVPPYLKDKTLGMGLINNINLCVAYKRQTKQ